MDAVNRLSLLGLALSGLVISACRPAAATVATPAAQKTTLVKVGLNSGAAPTGWPFDVAMSRGFFTAEGLSIESSALTSEATQVRALIAGDVNLTISGITVLAAVAEGAPLKYIATAQAAPNFQMIVAKDISSWSDLKGKTVAAGVSGSYFETILRAMMAANGLRTGDFQVFSMTSSTARFAALSGGQISGTLLSIPEENVAIKAGFKSLGYVSQVLPDVEYNGYVTSAQWASANETAVLKFLRALRRATDWLFDPSNKAEAQAIYGQVSKLGPDDLESAYDEMIVRHMLSQDLRPNLKGIQNYVKLAVDQGALDQAKVPSTDAWLDLSHLDKLAH